MLQGAEARRSRLLAEGNGGGNGGQVAAAATATHRPAAAPGCKRKGKARGECVSIDRAQQFTAVSGPLQLAVCAQAAPQPRSPRAQRLEGRRRGAAA